MSDEYIKPPNLYQHIESLSGRFNADIDISRFLRPAAIPVTLPGHSQAMLTITVGRTFTADRLMNEGEAVLTFDPPMTFEPGTYEINLTTGDVQRIEP